MKCLRRYATRFSVWDDGTIQCSIPGDYNLDSPDRPNAVDKAERWYAEHSGGLDLGWAIFDSETRGPEIERDDEAAVFDSDDEAVEAAIAFFDVCEEWEDARRALDEAMMLVARCVQEIDPLARRVDGVLIASEDWHQVEAALGAWGRASERFLAAAGRFKKS